MLFNEKVDINVKHSGLLEVPPGKEVDQLPQEHFQKLIDKKGYQAVIRGLTNLEVWNKNKNPELSQWASNMADKLKIANNKDESCSDRLFEAKMKLGKKIFKGLKSTGNYIKNSFAKSADTARNAIVAGATAPIGAGIAARTYNNPNNKQKKKEPRYSSADVASMAVAMRKDESLASHPRTEERDNGVYLKSKEADDFFKIKKLILLGSLGGTAATAGAPFIFNKIREYLVDTIKVSEQTIFKLGRELDKNPTIREKFIELLRKKEYVAKLKKILEKIPNLDYRIKTDSITAFYDSLNKARGPMIAGAVIFVLGYSLTIALIKKFKKQEEQNESYSNRLFTLVSILEEKQEIKKESGIKRAAKIIGGSTAGGAGIGGAMGAGLSGGLVHKGLTKLGLVQKKGIGKFFRRGLTGVAGTAGGLYGATTGAIKGLGVGAIGAGIDAIQRRNNKNESFLYEFARKVSSNKSHYRKFPDPIEKLNKKIIKKTYKIKNPDVLDPLKREQAIKKAKETKAKNISAKKAKTNREIMKPLADVAKETKYSNPNKITGTQKISRVKKAAKTASDTINKTASKTTAATEKGVKRVKNLFKKSNNMRKFLNKRFWTGAAVGAGTTAALGATAYGINKLRNRNR